MHTFKGTDIVFGGPPCQGFSIAGKMNSNDPRSQLLWVFMEVVKLTKPRAFKAKKRLNLPTIGIIGDRHLGLALGSYN
ncbi:MAG: hypothetical protein BRC44_10390 [Cyanobacteria bacterium QS_4_48_99]|nr:MAG: hypothetical protein BRC44_10390 [Cyanobacteria bacterium QS_4_48_99]